MSVQRQSDIHLFIRPYAVSQLRPFQINCIKKKQRPVTLHTILANKGPLSFYNSTFIPQTDVCCYLIGSMPNTTQCYIICSVLAEQLQHPCQVASFICQLENVIYKASTLPELDVMRSGTFYNGWMFLSFFCNCLWQEFEKNKRKNAHQRINLDKLYSVYKVWQAGDSMLSTWQCAVSVS